MFTVISTVCFATARSFMGRVEDRPMLDVEIAGNKFSALVDTGAAVTLLSWRAFIKMQERPRLLPARVKLRTVSGETLPVMGEAILPLVIGGRKLT